MFFKGAICHVTSCAYETDSAWFRVNLDGPEPLTYKWKRMYRWTNEWELLTNETNCFFEWTNADQWEDNSHVCVVVSNAAGETLELGPAKLEVYLMAISLPGSKTNGKGPASRYSATINVRGELTMGRPKVHSLCKPGRRRTLSRPGGAHRRACGKRRRSHVYL